MALVGLMGAGKSRVGRLLARDLGWPFADADALAGRAAGKSVEEIFRSEGEDRFRDLEAEILESLAGTPPPLVVALGGGVVEREGNRRILRESFFTVWLDVASAEAARRVGSRPGRPLLADRDPALVLAALSASRRAWYTEVARLRLSTGARTRPETLCRRIRDSLATAAD